MIIATFIAGVAVPVIGYTLVKFFNSDIVFPKPQATRNR